MPTPNNALITHRPQRTPADAAYRRAWWSLALYPMSALAAFVVGEGLFTWLDDDIGDPPFWVVVVCGVPAVLIFVLPAFLAMWQGRRAANLGRPDGMVPAIVSASIAAAFVATNLLSYLVGVIFE